MIWGEEIVGCEETLGDALEWLFFDREEARFVEGVFLGRVEEREGGHFRCAKLVGG